MKNVLLSIIVPVYGVEPFLRECLDSLFLQNIPESEYEVICVDDGSPDRSGEILDEYALCHGNMTVIHRQNAGVSAARNRGLDAAGGEYIWFVDPDDFIQDDFLETLFCCIKQRNVPDMITFGVYEFGDYTTDCSLSPEEKAQKKNLKNNRAPNEQYDATLCRHVYKRSLFTENGIRFDPLISVCEDNVVHFLAEGRVKTQAMLEPVGYFYRKRTNSLSSGSPERYYESRVRIATLFSEHYRSGYGNHYIAGYLLTSQLKLALLHIAKMKNPRRKTELARLKSLGLFPLKEVDRKDTFYEIKRDETCAANRRYNRAYNAIYTDAGYRSMRRILFWNRVKRYAANKLRRR